MITSVLDDNGYLVDDHAAAVKTTVTKHKKTFYEIPKGLEMVMYVRRLQKSKKPTVMEIMYLQQQSIIQ